MAAVYFLCFGLGAESLALYGTLLKKVGLRVSGDRSWVSAEQDMSLKGKRWVDRGLERFLWFRD